MNSAAPQPHILLLDHDDRRRHERAQRLVAAGWRCDAPAAPSDVLDSLREGHELIITDLVMPNRTCIEVLQALRNQNASRAIIVTSVGVRPHDVTELLREGALEVLTSPIDPERLCEVVARVVDTLSQRQFEQSLARFVDHQLIHYIIRTADLVGRKLPCSILDSLYLAGRIDLGVRLRLELAMQEALTNAVDHGNLELDSKWREVIDKEGRDHYSVIKEQRLADPTYADRTVEIRYEVEGTYLRIQYTDQGKGFIPAPRVAADSDNSVRCSGRGTAIIYGAVDEVRYNDRGNQITLMKRIAPLCCCGSCEGAS